MVSTLTKRNAEISFKALSLGAIDYVPKPDTSIETTLSADFRDEVVRKVKALGRKRPGVPAKGRLPRSLASLRRPFSLVPPRIIAIGSSTGGPEVLGRLLGAMSRSLSRVPVLVAQHMPPMFTTVLAERLARATRREAKEGSDGEPVKPGTVYVAPGDRHMTLVGFDAPAIRLGTEPPVNFCRPAVDPPVQKRGCKLRPGRTRHRADGHGR
jgi:two-component system chemotaxis response regulator CheB